MTGTFYRNIKKSTQGYRVVKKGECYGSFPDLATALFERDRLIAVDWDWDDYVNLPDQYNNYIHVNLPPFENEPSYISVEKEHWIVRDKITQKYRGRYNTLEEAKRVARIYDGNISHKKQGFAVRRHIDGVSVYFGRYKTWEEAKERVEELKKNDWRK